MKHIASRSFTAFLIAAVVAIPALTRADDTDIYTSGASTGGEPLVMFSIDIRPSTGSTFQCTSTAAPAVDANGKPTVGCLYYLTHNSATACEFTSNNNATVTDPFHLTAAGASSTITCGNTGTISSVGDYFEFLRLSMKVALYDFEDKGLYVGLMINHNDANGCAGPSNATVSKCSNGGMITMGFTHLVHDHVALNRMNDQLSGLKFFATDTNGSAGKHPYQGTELFFELFRYLTGIGNQCSTSSGTHCGQIYNGHVGNADFDSGSGDNINVRKVLSAATPADTDKGQHCGPGTAPGNYTAGALGTSHGSGSNAYKDEGACFDNSSSGNTYPDQIGPVEKISTHDYYVSPLTGDNTCGKIFTVNYLNGQVNKDTDSNTEIALPISQGGLGFNPGTNGANQVVGALHTLNLRNPPTFAGDGSGAGTVTSYFFGSGQAGPEAPGLATAGGTPLISIDPAAANNNGDVTVKVLEGILSQILTVSTTFVASAIPANVFNRAQSLDSVYIALFQPRSDTNNWYGNLKKLKIQGSAGGDILVDTNGNNAVNPTDGRIDPAAVTFWTDPSISMLNQTQQVNNVPVTGWRSGDATATTDGRQVNRGGAGQKVPGYAPNATASPGLTNSPATNRQVFYQPSSGSTLLDLNVNNSTTGTTEVDLCASGGPLGLTGPSDSSCEPLLKYMRGICTSASDSVTGACTASPLPPRSWMMGDPLHSRPQPINYGALSGYSSSNPAIYVAMGGNDGALHMIRNTNTDGTQSGKEVWAFMPRASMAVQKKLLNNTGPHTGVYSLDGTPVAWVNDANGNGTVGSGETVYLYMGMRRGGRVLFALDVTSPEAKPTLLWTIGSGTTGFSELGYTFSNPKIGVLNVNGTPTTVAFFAGGYDPNKDAHAVGTNDSMGRAIYAVNATTGTLIWKATAGASTGQVAGGTASSASYTHAAMKDSIPAEVSIGDTDGDGYIDRLVVGDTGGNVWRADFSGTDARKWSVILLAKLGRWGADAAGNSSKADDRRFESQAKIVQTEDANGTRYDAVVVGSGDREDPLDAGGATTNYFYNIRDNQTGLLSVDASNNPPADVNRTDAQITNIDDATVTCLLANNCATTPSFANGWKIQLSHSSSPHSEKSLASALVINNVVFFTTYLPAQTNGTSCTPSEGTGLFYAVSLLNSLPVSNYDSTTSGISSASDRSTALSSSGIPAQPV